MTTGHISTRLRTSQAECSQSGARRTGRPPAAAVRAGPGWGAPETRVWRATGAAVFIERVLFPEALAPPGLEQTAERPPRPPADATHRSIYPFVNNPLLAHPAGSNWPAPAGAGALGGRWSFLVRIYLKNTHRLTVKQSRLVPGPGGVGEVWRVTGGPLARSVVCRGRLKDSPCEWERKREGLRSCVRASRCSPLIFWTAWC